MSRLRGQFGAVPSWVDERCTDGTAMRIYVRLARKYASADRDAFPLIETLAEELGMSQSSVKRALSHLREIQAIQVHRSAKSNGERGRNYYRLPMDDPRDIFPGQLEGSNMTSSVDQGSNMTSSQGSYLTPRYPDPLKENQTHLRPADAATTETASPAEDEGAGQLSLVPAVSAPSKPKVRAKPKTHLPDSWVPTDKAASFALANGLNVKYEALQFRNYWLAQGRPMADWDAAFRTWLNNALKWAKERGGGSAAPAPRRPQPSMPDGSAAPYRTLGTVRVQR